MNEILRSIQDSVPDCVYCVNIPLGRLRENLDLYKTNMCPNYQRDYVWNIEQKQNFVGAFLENCKSIPPIWMNWVSIDHNRSHSEVVDGKQRINACLNWLDGDFEAICPCGETVAFKDLNKVDIRNINMSVTFVWNFVELSDIDVMKYYLKLNSGGTVHSADDLNKVKNMIDNLSKD
jgi:hypothetical protein